MLIAGRGDWIAQGGPSRMWGNFIHEDPGRSAPGSFVPVLPRACSLRTESKRSRQMAGSSLLVGVTGFEPATTCTPCKCATGLRYTPKFLVPHFTATIPPTGGMRYRAELNPKGRQMYDSAGSGGSDRQGFPGPIQTCKAIVDKHLRIFFRSAQGYSYFCRSSLRVLRITLVLRLLLVMALLAFPLAGGLWAQPPVGGQPPCWPPPCIPIDGGVGLLIAAGALLGGRTAWGARRARKSSI